MPAIQLPNSQRYTLQFSGNDAVLGVTTKGGGGHLMAMNALQSEFRRQNPNGLFRVVDVIKDSYPPLIDDLAANLISSWDEAKKKGDIIAQEWIVNGKILGINRRRLGDLFFFIPVFIATFFKLLFNRKITHIIDTQPIATSAVIKAARLINFIFDRTIKVIKIMTDLPTKEAKHYSASARLLSENDKKVYQLVAAKPFKKRKDESEADYLLRQEYWWNEHFSLSLQKGQVVYSDFPIRPAFKLWQSVPSSQKASTLSVKCNNEDEYAKINDLLNGVAKTKAPYGSDPTKEKEVIKVDTGDNAVVGMVTIGSQAAVKTKNYVHSFIEMVKTHGEDDKEYVLFVGCGRHTPGSKTLFKDVYDIIKSKNDLPDNVKIIPLGFQDDDEFAPMMHRADFGIYGAGGQTMMEVNSVAKGKVFIHSEKNLSDRQLKALSEDKILKKLMKGFALWEKGNVRYQMTSIDATPVIAGEYFSSQLLKAGIFTVRDNME